jgi:aspartyl-tRNA(Asn)/glutamyl-tRNA(Gln) amidotransferase subunit C
MKKADIQHLARLSRIAVTDTEAEALQGEISSILDYVGQIQKMTGTGETEKTPGAIYNVMRADEITNEPGQYTEAIMAEMPAREGRFMKVKKILSNDE